MIPHSERHIFVDADYRLQLWLWVDWCVDSFVHYNGGVVVRQNGGAFTVLGGKLTVDNLYGK